MGAWKDPDYLKKYYRANRAKAKAYNKAYAVRAKLEAFTHYCGGKSPACACCGESIMDFLTLDHINGHGTKQRERIRRGGHSFCAYLRTRGYPPGFRVLCFNCNCARRLGPCPHERLKNVAVI